MRIAFLPARKFWKPPAFSHPQVAGNLNIFDIVAQANGRVQVRENVKMIFHSIDSIQVAFVFFYYAPNIFV